MYLGLVFFTDISCHKTGTSLISCASLFIRLSPLPEPTSFKVRKLAFQETPCIIKRSNVQTMVLMSFVLHRFAGPAISGSQASSQAASISGGAGGGSGSAASSHASSFGLQGSGTGFGASSSSANSQSFSSSLGRPGGGYGYYPAGGMSASSSQSAGASFGVTGSSSSENLPRDFTRHFLRGYKYSNNKGRKNRPRWSDQVFSLDKKSAITYQE